MHVKIRIQNIPNLFVDKGNAAPCKRLTSKVNKYWGIYLMLKINFSRQKDPIITLPLTMSVNVES